MKKLAFVFAAIAVAALTGASAEELGARVGDRDMSRDRDFRAARAEFAYGEHDRGFIVGVLVPIGHMDGARAERWAGAVVGALLAVESRAAAASRHRTTRKRFTT